MNFLLELLWYLLVELNVGIKILVWLMIILLYMNFAFQNLSIVFVTAPYFIYFSNLFKKCMKIKIIHRPLTPTFVSIEEKMIFHFHLKKKNKMFPNVFYCYTVYTVTHILTGKTHDRAYSVFFCIVSVSSTEVSFTVILWMYYLSYLHEQNIIHTLDKKINVTWSE